MEFNKIGATGCRVVGAMTDLGHTGPKHHGVIIGRGAVNNEIYVAEYVSHGCQLVTYESFAERYLPNGEVRLFENEGKLDSGDVARRALGELTCGGKGAYNLLTNNCESFVNRAMHGNSVSNQIVNTALLIITIIGTCWIVKKYR
jgi:hypothetical protein